MRRVWARWLVPLVTLALLGLGQAPAAAADRPAPGPADSRLTLVVALSPGGAYAGPGRAELRLAGPTRERAGTAAVLAPPPAGPGTGSRFRTAPLPAASPPVTPGTRTGARSPPAHPAR